MDEPERNRDAAIKRVNAKRDFKKHAALYVIVNLVLVVIWALSGKGYFWPIWPIAGWGIGLALHGWSAYFQKPISEDDIRRELETDK